MLLAIKAGATEGDSAALDFLIDFIIYIGIVVEREDGSLAKGEVEADTFAKASATVPVSGVEARTAVGTPTVFTSPKSVSVTVQFTSNVLSNSHKNMPIE